MISVARESCTRYGNYTEARALAINTNYLRFTETG